MASKVFVGTWISKDSRTKLKVACANHGAYQGDVIELLILKWLREPHISESDSQQLVEAREN